MTFTESIATCFGKYATFSGRACRSEFWWFSLFVGILDFMVALADGAAGTNGILVLIFLLGLLLPVLAVTVRRLHDTDRSGWWLLLTLIPFIGPLVLTVFYAIAGDDGDNRFGPDPLAIEA